MAPLGKRGPAGTKHRPGGCSGGWGHPETGARLPLPLQKDSRPTSAVRSRAWPWERALRTGLLLLACHLSMKALILFYFNFSYLKRKKVFFKKKREEKLNECNESPGWAGWRRDAPKGRGCATAASPGTGWGQAAVTPWAQGGPGQHTEGRVRLALTSPFQQGKTQKRIK